MVSDLGMGQSLSYLFIMWSDSEIFLNNPEKHPDGFFHFWTRIMVEGRSEGGNYVGVVTLVKERLKVYWVL